MAGIAEEHRESILRNWDRRLWSGALIHYQDSTTGSYTELADFTTGTSSMSDPALPVGQNLDRPIHEPESFRVNSAHWDSLTVTVN
jgi:hypothetical protein